MGQGDVRLDERDQDLPVLIDVRGQASGENYLVQVKDALWTEGGEHQFSKSACLVEYVLDPGAAMEVFAMGAERREYEPLRGASFFPSFSEVHCRWKPGRQRSLTCSFDLSTLLADAEIDGVASVLPVAVDIRSGPLVATLRQVADEMLTPRFASALHIRSLLISAAVHLGRAMQPARPEAVEHGKLSSAQMQALRDLVQCPDTALTLDEIARVCAVSPRRLSRLYRNTSNHTLRSYVAAAKIERAHAMLAQGAPIKQVAHACGFLSVPAFTAAFRKATGTTPGRLRA